MEQQSSYTKEELLSSGRGELFGPGNAQLPLPPMLMMDRITHISEEGGAFGKGQIRAEFDITEDLWFFECHFNEDPVMPGCLGVDAMWQLIGFFLERCVEYLFGTKSIKPFRLLWVLAIPVGALAELDFIWLLADTLNALMALPNLIALLMLSPVVFALTREYFSDKTN